jgi:hypothetical protein
MKARIYVRVAKRPPYGRGGPYKIDASHLHDQRPLEVGGKPLRTLHFAVEVQVPDELFKDPMIPVVSIEIQGDGTFRDEPHVVQIPVDVPEDVPEVVA